MSNQNWSCQNRSQVRRRRSSNMLMLLLFFSPLSGDYRNRINEAAAAAPWIKYVFETNA